jgi:hypothetical protein
MKFLFTRKKREKSAVERMIKFHMSDSSPLGCLLSEEKASAGREKTRLTEAEKEISSAAQLFFCFTLHDELFPWEYMK